MLVNTFRKKGGERNKGDLGGAGHVLFFRLGWGLHKCIQYEFIPPFIHFGFANLP